MNKQPLHIRLEADIHKRLQKQAKSERRTKTAIVKAALVTYFQRIDRGEEN